MTKSTVYNSRKSRALIAQANSHNFLYKIGDGENVATFSTLADARAHGDVGCARKITESGSILWHHRLVKGTMSRFFNDSTS